jgi:hypothetical protein
MERYVTNLTCSPKRQTHNQQAHNQQAEQKNNKNKERTKNPKK